MARPILVSAISTLQEEELEGSREEIRGARQLEYLTTQSGPLAVSRAFGDAGFKVGGMVIAEPDVAWFEAEEADFLLLICDGITEEYYANLPEINVVCASDSKTCRA